MNRGGRWWLAEKEREAEGYGGEIFFMEGTRKLGIKYCYNGSRAVRMYYHHSKSWGYYTAAAATRVMVDPLERVAKLASENAVVIFSLGSCCMCHAVGEALPWNGREPDCVRAGPRPEREEDE
ncbi:hypothetical protein CK203_063227 [Vitis vinifera]|uniref:Uncharacterized protein n=1 Tax=Vitis vinifera TaxID=29760 RepID=A0A438FSW8_VITVI|nr:hypothetical protein CK203_063227 [Vitis vinifera]